jgi:hypothetical protein
MSETTVPLRLSAPLKERVRELASRNHRSMTQEVVVAIERHVGFDVPVVPVEQRTSTDRAV